MESSAALFARRWMSGPPQRTCVWLLRFSLSMGLVSLLAVPALADTQTAEYAIVFDATWSEATHPGTLPPSPHFSGLIGALHNDQVSFWDVGALASDGIERMAEVGGKAELTLEVNAAISAGTADRILSGGGISTSPDSVSLHFIADRDYPRMTLVSMLAPSPDWFVGTNALNLRAANQWRQEIVVPLYVYDAGTDSGASFLSGNQNTNPADPIALFDASFFAPPQQFVGTYTITRTDSPPPAMVPALATKSALVLAGSLVLFGYFAARRLWRAPT